MSMDGNDPSFSFLSYFTYKLHTPKVFERLSLSAIKLRNLFIFTTGELFYRANRIKKTMVKKTPIIIGVFFYLDIFFFKYITNTRILTLIITSIIVTIVINKL